jgi:hypothetical protein
VLVGLRQRYWRFVNRPEAEAKPPGALGGGGTDASEFAHRWWRDWMTDKKDGDTRRSHVGPWILPAARASGRGRMGVNASRVTTVSGSAGALVPARLSSKRRQRRPQTPKRPVYVGCASRAQAHASKAIRTIWRSLLGGL